MGDSVNELRSRVISALITAFFRHSHCQDLSGMRDEVSCTSCASEENLCRENRRSQQYEICHYPRKPCSKGLYRKSFMPDSREQYLEEVIQQSLILNEQEK
jgi:hypothetical protein